MKLRNKILQLLKPLTLVKGDLTKHMEAMTRIGKTRIATIIGITTCDSFAEKYSSLNSFYVQQGWCAADKERDRKSFDDRVGGWWKSEPGGKKRLYLTC